MLSFIGRRLLQAMFVLLIISFVSFMIQDKMGDPVRQMVGQSVTLEQREALQQELGLNDPMLIQYGRFLGRAIQGDLGTSYYYKEPTIDVIASRLPATLELSFAALVLVILLAIPLGVFAAIHPKNILSRAVLLFSTLGLSVPIFIVAVFLMYFFAIEWGLLPSFGRGETTSVFGLWQSGLFNRDGLRHLLLPSLSLAFVLTPIFIRLIRAEMMDVLQSDYIRYAWAKGISAPRIYFVHALKNTMLPVITVGGIQLGTLVAYTILTESIFQWPGMGLLFMDAVTRVDVPLISTYLIFVGVIFVVTNTLVDVVYSLVNPRVRIPGYS
ncbi:Dipeptide transport system permease protein DppB [Marinomonas gallaica]|uniref:Dipeptide transport system permease protein DppB n=1 Tax=Marinomonas gallaica TaxID=1806667 RepID=A0A1C3JMM8_9GAMM|nr:ABC transporter permease [Marinomonas gallaica]SBT16377.1 Dipeptide transport system permease protein DppB [Marinomonas gallaica]SBT21425.1 Dipeptide transport system permease protein DppB [Marinomonas gallaica]